MHISILSISQTFDSFIFIISASFSVYTLTVSCRKKEEVKWRKEKNRKDERRIENLEYSIALRELFCVCDVAEILFSVAEKNGNTQVVIQSPTHMRTRILHTNTHAHRESVWCIRVCVAAHAFVCKIYLVCKCDLQRTSIMYYCK